MLTTLRRMLFALTNRLNAGACRLGHRPETRRGLRHRAVLWTMGPVSWALRALPLACDLCGRWVAHDESWLAWRGSDPYRICGDCGKSKTTTTLEHA